MRGELDWSLISVAFTCWIIWKVRNVACLQDKNPDVYGTIKRIQEVVAEYEEIIVRKKEESVRKMVKKEQYRWQNL